MKKLITLALLAAMGLALAQTQAGGEDWTIGDDQGVSVSEQITVTIPVRYALHLTEDSWVIDLAADPFPAAQSDWSVNSERLPEEACYLVPKAIKNVDQLRAYLAKGGVLKPAYNYPAIHDYDDDGRISNDEKGTVLCLNKKILQKFSNNPDGWQLSVEVTSSDTDGFGVFGLGDKVMPNGPADGFTTTTLPYGPDVVAQGQGTTGGWLDDLIVEGFWFDGTEAAGDYDITVTFTLSSL